MAPRRTTTYGFARTSKLLNQRVREAAESRGFAESRVLTHWEEIAGSDLSAIARPVEITYAKGGFGATLVVLTTGAQAPIVEMRREELRARINATYGYEAIRRVHVTQTAATGFADGQVDFVHRPKAKPAKSATLSPELARQARDVTSGVSDGDLRVALERLAANVISKGQREG